MGTNFSSKLIFLSVLIFFGIILIPAPAQGDCTCNCLAPCDGHYCEICCAEGWCNLVAHTICLPWQKCEVGIECDENTCWCYFKGCNCCGSCMKAPENPRYYDNPNYPTTPCFPEQSLNPGNIYLPAKLDWDDVEGWKDGWIGEKTGQCLEECAGMGGSKEECCKGCLQYCSCAQKCSWIENPLDRAMCIQSCQVSGGAACEEKCNEIGYGGKPTPVICLPCGGMCDGEPSENCPCVPEYWRNLCKSDCDNKCQQNIKFYQIKITGESRDPEVLREIDVLNKKIEEEADPRRVSEYEAEIERLRKEELEISEYKEFLDKSEFIAYSCLFKSNRNYQWQVRACCSKNEETCGAWSGPWEFTTNAAPEPKLPYDPDWQGPEKIEDLSYEESRKLQWCKIEDPVLYEETTVYGEKNYRPLSYNALIYYLDDDLCHPQLSFGGQCVPDVLSPDKAQGEKLPPDEFTDYYSVFFTKETPYAWKIAACKDTHGFECTDYSQLWRFETGDWPLSVAPVNPLNDNQTPVGLPVLLKWTSEGANSFNYELIGVSSGTTTVANVAFDYPQLALNTVYSWRVQPCSDYEGKECEDTWYGPWLFKTTGQPPQLTYPLGNDIPIPINFDWEDVPGAKSYVFKIQGGELSKEEPTEKSEFLLDYPELKQETDYTWQVKTCAKEGGNACGAYSNPQSFRTFKLKTPAGLKPEDNGEIYTYQPIYNISWEPVAGARFYQFEVSYVGVDPEDPKSEECQGLLGEKIVLSPDDIVSRSSASLPLSCWGDYQWQVKACLDISCQESGDYSSLQTFNFVAKEAPPETRGWGLVPCGRTTDDPSTTWRDETERCQVKHIFIMFFLVIDFLLWKVIPLILVLLVLASGVIFYFSAKLEAPTPLAKVKSLWKAAGIGLAIIFFAWTIVSFFLTLFGYQVGIFGPWWQIF